ncbi:MULTISPECIES: PspA/IM30 family protein [Protofrankia]|uniref:Phage shock protein PspA n=1 Tax=Candidatus Protofrankia californiensis TaxID=1839754 RepID=A0A1C3PCD5_9ACTN|nr:MULTISPECIES: PspA/IM30 family protein [Protofrankia]SBW27487.1 phage shock protein PspA [Candidatus Protofrankia californiensis]
MANVVRKLYRYLSASANRKLDEKADPRVQIDQAITEAQRQHQALVQQAAAVVGNQRQLEMRMARQIDEVESLTESARQAVLLADAASSNGEVDAAGRYEQTAQAFASQLVAAEGALDDLKALHQQAVLSAEQARRAVEDNTLRLQGQLTERARLLTQIEHAAMQEQMSKALDGMSQLTPPSDTPTLAQVRDKVEQRYAISLGRHELASQGVESRMLEIRRASLDAKASNRLAEIRTALSAGPRADGAGSGDQLSLDKGSPGRPDA